MTEVRSLNKINEMINNEEIGASTLITQNQNVLTEDFALADGFSGVVTSGFTIADNIILTIPDGSTLSVV